MNAQEALDKIKELLNEMKKETLEALKETEDKIAGLIPKEQMTEEEHFNWIDEIDQSNTKPKTLEELGWEADDRFTVVAYTKDNTYHNTCSILFVEERKEIETWGDCSLSHEEILAIAEKMKELGMTNE